MSDATGPDTGSPDPSKLTQSQVKLRRGTRFFFESKAPVEPAQPPAPETDPVGDSPNPAAEHSAAAPEDPAKPPVSDPPANPEASLPPIDDAAPTKIINPASLRTQKFPEDMPTGGGGESTEASESRPTVMKGGKTIARMPREKTSGQMRRVDSTTSPAKLPPAPRGAGLPPVDEDLGKTHDLELIFGHLKDRPGSGARSAVPLPPAVGPNPTPGAGAANPPGTKKSASGLRGPMGPVPSSGKRSAAPGSGRLPAPPAKPGALPAPAANVPPGTHFSAPAGGPNESGTLFANFTLIKELTIGGFGEVWTAVDMDTNKEVVIKRLKPEQAEYKRAFYQFDIEIEIGQRVKHPNLVPVLQHGIHDGRRFFTMPRITGPSLTRILQKRVSDDWKLSPNEILAALEMIGRALGFLHRAGVVHCDLKPDNILFSARNRPMLIDLGIARTLNWEQTGYRALKAFREDNSILGTPEYMAPELFLGDPDKVGIAADLYALGVILYEVLTGATPFKREVQKGDDSGTRALVDLMDRVQKSAPPEVLARNHNAPPALAELAMKCLSKDPTGRPKTADEFAVVIGRVLRPTTLPAPNGKPGALGRLTKLIRKPGKPKP